MIKVRIMKVKSIENEEIIVAITVTKIIIAIVIMKIIIMMMIIIIIIMRIKNSIRIKI